MPRLVKACGALESSRIAGTPDGGGKPCTGKVGVREVRPCAPGHTAGCREGQPGEALQTEGKLSTVA